PPKPKKPNATTAAPMPIHQDQDASDWSISVCFLVNALIAMASRQLPAYEKKYELTAPKTVVSRDEPKSSVSSVSRIAYCFTGRVLCCTSTMLPVVGASALEAGFDFLMGIGRVRFPGV